MDDNDVHIQAASSGQHTDTMVLSPLMSLLLHRWMSSAHVPMTWLVFTFCIKVGSDSDSLRQALCDVREKYGENHTHCVMQRYEQARCGHGSRPNCQKKIFGVYRGEFCRAGQTKECNYLFWDSSHVDGVELPCLISDGKVAAAWQAGGGSSRAHAHNFGADNVLRPFPIVRPRPCSSIFLLH